MFKFPFLSLKKQNRASLEGPQFVAHDQHALERRQFQTVLESYHATRIEQRLKILDIFLSTEQHITLSDLEYIIREKDPELLDRSFLKETMEMFCQFGFARKMTFDGQHNHYEHKHLGAHHDHFICTRCGYIQEFVNQGLEQLQLKIARDFQFHPLQHKMEIYGLCAKCMEQRATTLPLLLAANGEEVCIVALEGGKGLQARLASMGLTIGTKLEVINNHASGPFIVAVNETRLALGVDMAQKILVTHECKHPRV
ncbi:MAG: transcriptional repressor [Proteobacteria bacterium]|nr:transcriptional repressor [Pseudomonadota bacterium]MBU1708840.1 transcriptional repressor [Pseudomonadota bacterium]